MSLKLLYLIFVVCPAIAGEHVMVELTWVSSSIGWFVAWVVPLLPDTEGAVGTMSAVRSSCRKVSLICCAFLMLCSLVPNEKQIMFITGGYAVTNNAELQKMPENILKAVNSYLGTLAKPEEKSNDHK